MLSEGREEYWFDDAGQITVYHQREQLDKAKTSLREEGKSITLGRVVVVLTFGFWKAMLNNQHENLWQTVLHKAARREDSKGGDAQGAGRPGDADPGHPQPHGAP